MENENSSKLDEMERGSLQKAISDVETALAVSSPGTRVVLENFLRNARGRVDALEKKIKDSEAEREAHSRMQFAVSMQLAEKESALNAAEKQAYAGFLNKEFFTKADFGRLEGFYTRTWDRLSEGGKDEMSHRIWEGVRRGKYEFRELPDAVREKEAEQAYKRLTASAIGNSEMRQISVSDRADFIGAYERGNRPEAVNALNRSSFKEHMFGGPESAKRTHTTVEEDRESEKGSTAVRLDASARDQHSSRVPTSAGKQEMDLSGLGLDELKIHEVETAGKVSDLPNAKLAPKRNTSSARD